MASEIVNGIAGGIGALLLGIFAIYAGAKRYSFVQKTRNTPTSKIASAAVGLVELCGKPAPLDEGAGSKGFISPVSKQKCIYYTVRAGFREPIRNRYVPIYSSGSHTAFPRFYLQDESGKVLIDPNGAQLDIPPDHHLRGYISGRGLFGVPRQKLDQRALDFIRTLEPGVQMSFDLAKYFEVFVIETYITEDDQIYVMGEAVPKEGAPSPIGSENLIVKKGKSMFISDSGERKAVEGLMGEVYAFFMLGILFCGLGIYGLAKAFFLLA